MSLWDREDFLNSRSWTSSEWNHIWHSLTISKSRWLTVFLEWVSCCKELSRYRQLWSLSFNGLCVSDNQYALYHGTSCTASSSWHSEAAQWANRRVFSVIFQCLTLNLARSSEQEGAGGTWKSGGVWRERKQKESFWGRKSAGRPWEAQGHQGLDIKERQERWNLSSMEAMAAVINDSRVLAAKWLLSMPVTMEADECQNRNSSTGEGECLHIVVEISSGDCTRIARG